MFVLRIKKIKSKIVLITILITLIIDLSIILIFFHSFHTLLYNSLIDASKAYINRIVIGSDKKSYLYISTRLLTQSLNSETLPSDSHFLLTMNHKTYNLLDPDFNEISYTMTQSQTTSKESCYLTTLIDDNGHKYTYITLPCSVSGWYLSQSLSELELKNQRQLYLYLILPICSIVLLAGICLAIYLNRIINLPIAQILKTISDISNGNFKYAADIEWDNELGDIGKGINSLSNNVLQLMNESIKTEKEKRELEYQILQSQINPHFLYNTLNSIKWMATIQKASGIAEMTTALSKLMRAISKDSAQIVILQDEINLLDQYFLIQKYRYGGTLSLNYQISNQILYQLKLPKFSLQPIVENAIFHGIEPKGEAGVITITSYLVNDQEWIIEVTDNGIGMTNEQINILLSENDHSESEFFKKIGIHNVNQRIKYTFGVQYGLHIESELGHYTTVFIHLPFHQIKL